MTPKSDIVEPKRTRESTSKVRTGCSTCKIRRVKCDEGKPACRRCAVGGRNCDYNTAIALPPRRNVITVYLPPTRSQPVFFVKERSVDFFHRKIAANLDGQFNSEFWSKLVMQLSHSESSVRHAVSSISIIYRDIESSSPHSASYMKSIPEAQQQWNKAIRSLSARIEAHPNSNLVPLVCCLLFTCFEFLRGNRELALLHAQSGFNILLAIRRNSDSTPNLSFSTSSDDLKAIENHIIPIFSGLNTFCSLAGAETPPIHDPRAKEDSPQENFTHSMLQLLAVSDQCIRFIGKTDFKAAVFQINFDDLAEQAKLQAKLKAWRDRLDGLVERMKAFGDHVNNDAVNSLLTRFKVIQIWLSVCTTAGEMAADAYRADFEELVCCAENILKPGIGTATPQALSFDLQNLGPLYYAAMKCRYSSIRKRALELLRLVPRKEGLWNAHYAYVTAKRVIEIEEMHLNEQGLPEDASRIYYLPLPDDSDRIRCLGGIGSEFQKSEHSITPSLASFDMIKVELQSKPWGLLGEWHTVTEYIKL